MKSIIARFKMFRMLSKLDTLFDRHDGILSGDQIDPFVSSVKKMATLRRLSDAGAVKLTFYSNELLSIRRLPGASLYLLERSELWVNRIAGFIVGVATAVVAELIIRTIF